jgi:glycosyltransferase involved in cell wall biosynthesis
MKISVVIPVHNAAAWLRETLETIYNQTYPREDIEILITDDESTDASARIAREFLQERRMKGDVIPNKSNGGCGAPRNAAWPHATGDWVQFLDGDDLLEPKKFEWQLAYAATAPEDVAVIYSPWKHYELRDGVWGPREPMIQSYVDNDSLVSILEDWDFGFVGPTIVRRSFLPKIGGFTGELLLGEDFDFMLRTAMSGPGRFHKVPTPEAAFLYRATPGSMWRRATKRVAPMKALANFVRNAELHLLQNGGLTLRAREALGGRYAKYLDFFMETDEESYRRTLGWIRDLDVDVPRGVGKRMQVISKMIGYERALALRLSLVRAKSRMVSTYQNLRPSGSP